MVAYIHNPGSPLHGKTLQQAIGVLGVSDTGDMIDVEAVELIHQIEHEQDGYIGLCRKINDGWHTLAGVSSHRLREYLPQLLPYLLEDSYFTVNAAWRAQRWNDSTTGLPAPCLREEHLRYLNACYVDLDIYKHDKPLDLWDALAVIGKAQDEGLFLPASIIGRSGRGIYMLWLLNNGRQGAKQRAFPGEIRLYKQIHDAIHERLHELEPRLNADHNAKDAARMLRLPGSVNTKAENRDRVRFIVQATGRGIAPTYSLEEMAESFAVRYCLYPTGKRKQLEQDFYTTMFENGRPIKNRGSCPARSNGTKVSGQLRVDDLKVIEQHQGGFKQGKRRQSIVRFAHFAKAAQWSLSEILAEAKSIASNCIPPYPSDKNDLPVSKIVDGVWVDPPKHKRSDKLAHFFGVTHDFAEEHGLRSIIPAETRAARAARPSQREANQTARREAILAILREHPGRVPHLRPLKASLENMGHKAALETVRSDLKAALLVFVDELTPNRQKT